MNCTKLCDCNFDGIELFMDGHVRIYCMPAKVECAKIHLYGLLVQKQLSIFFVHLRFSEDLIWLPM